MKCGNCHALATEGFIKKGIACEACSKSAGWIVECYGHFNLDKFDDRSCISCPHEIGCKMRFPYEEIHKKYHTEGTVPCPDCGVLLGQVHRSTCGGSTPIEADPSGADPQTEPAKLDAGKPKADLMFSFGLAQLAVAEVCTFGTEKYFRGSWEEVPDAIHRYQAAAARHLFKGNQEHLDPDSGLPHIDHAIWNLMAARELELRKEK